jgi:hypothetical protein
MPMQLPTRASLSRDAQPSPPALDTHHAPEPQIGVGDQAEILTRVAELSVENERLQQMLDQARGRLEKMERMSTQWQAREQEYERILEEKSELIRQLHGQIEAGGVGQSDGEQGQASGHVPQEDELVALEQALQAEREQLRQDEEALMAEMRNMEVSMARERADLARQRTELQRLHTQFKHELEIAMRDQSLRDRLAPLYGLQEDIQRRNFGSDSKPRCSFVVRQEQVQQQAAVAPPVAALAPPTNPTPQPQQSTSGSSGFFRRMFGK